MNFYILGLRRFSMKKGNDKQILRLIKKLNEFQTRWYVAREATVYGRGGIKRMREITGMSRTTVIKGIKELKNKTREINGRMRKIGGGRKKRY